MVSLSTPAFAADEPAAAASENVKVHISGSNTARLERKSTEGNDWTSVCKAPCDKPLPADAQYRIVGDGVSPSKGFHLQPSKDGSVTLTVAEKDKGNKTLGYGTLIGGGVLVLAGGLVIGLGPGPSKVFGSDGQSHPGHLNAVWVGSGLILAGIAVAIGGTSIVVNDKEADVSGGVTAMAQAEADARDVAPKALPVVSSAPGFMVPVFSGTF